MALTNEVTYLIKLAADMSAATRGAESIKLLEDAYKKLGLTIDATDKISVKSAKTIGEGKNAYLQTTVAVQSMNGAINTATFQAQKLNGQMQVLSTGLSNVAKSGQAAVSVQHSLLGTFGEMIERALIVAPAWMLVRTAIEAVTGAFADAIKFMNEFDSALAKIQVSGNLTREQTIKLSRDVLKLGETYGFTFDEISKSTKSWITNGNNMAETVLLVKNSMQLAILTGESLSKSTERMDTVMDTFSITAKDSSRILDDIAVAMKANGSGADDIVAGLERIGPVANQANISLEDTLGIITAIQSITGRTGARTADAFGAIINRININSAEGLQSATGGKVDFFEQNGKSTSNPTATLRNTRDILKDLSSVWSTLTATQQQNIAISAAGMRSTKEFTALMDTFAKANQVSIDALLGHGTAEDSVSTATKTLTKNLEELNNQWHGLFATDKFANIENFFVNLAKGAIKSLNPNLLLGGLIGGVGSSHTTQAEKEIIDLNKSSEAHDKKAKSMEGVLKVYVKMRDDLKLTNDAIQKAELRGDQESVNALRRRKADEFSITKVKIERELGRNLSANTPESFLNNLGILNPDTIDTMIKEESRATIDKLTASAKQIKAEHDKLLNDLSIKTTRNGDTLSISVREEKSQKARELESKYRENLLSIAHEEAVIKNESNLLDAKRLEKLKEIEKVQENIVKSAFTNQQILDQINELEADLVSRGVSSQYAKIAALSELKSRLDSNGLPIDKATRTALNAKEKAVGVINNQRTTAEQDQGIQNIIAQMKIYGANDIEIQEKIISLENERANLVADTFNKEQEAAGNSLRIKADTFKVEQERLKLTQKQNEQIAAYSNKLQSSFSGSLSEVLLGNSGATDFLNNVSATIRSTMAGAASESITSGLFKKTGIGAIFGNMTAGLANIANPLTSPISNAHLQGILQGVPAIIQAHQAGLSGGGGASSSTSGGFFSNLLSKLGDFKNPGIMGGLASASLGALGGFGGGPFGGGVKGSIFGALGGIASAINPIIGAGVGLLGGLFGLFRRPKSTTTVREETKDFQVASRVDVTNNKLDIVNRNLVALKQSFDTFVLPESAAFATKNSIEDNFSLAARRGLI